MNFIEILEMRDEMKYKDEIHIYTDNVYSEERPKDKLKLDENGNDNDFICSVDLFYYLTGCYSASSFLYSNFLVVLKSTINRKLKKYDYIVYNRDEEDSNKYEYKVEAYFLTKKETIKIILNYRKKYGDNGTYVLNEMEVVENV